ncbi:MAG: electron transport protein SCO1/SenC [Betaproteobacteria bacterium]|nr:electron transport protein SCO1/SenC [Betaproteobacteria bacterium]
MKHGIITVLAMAALSAASPAWPHTETQKPDAGATPRAAAPPAAKEGAGGTRDARSYFTDLELQTQDGRKVRFYSDVLEGRTVLINVIYTSCKDACPLITQQLNDVRSRMPELFGKQVFFVTLTSDPKRDTPQALKKFAQKQSADVEGWTFLTGRKDRVDHILKKLGQFSEEVEGHSTLLIAGNVPAKRWSKIRPDAPAQAIVARLSDLAIGGAGATGAAQ